jgi:signal transduction histidine kinase
VAHDLRTPLTTIQGYVDLLPRAGTLTEQQRDYITRMQRSMSAVTQLVSDLVDVSRIELGLDLDMVTADLESIITDAVEESRSVAEDKELDLQVRMPKGLTSLSCFPRRVHQAVSNLVSNAVKYTSPQGHITVDVEETENHIAISVTDDGLGIPAADQPYVFDKFFRVDLPETRDIPGSGLGLSIVKSVVEQHGGRVWLESAHGRGSTFTLLLPKC